MSNYESLFTNLVAYLQRPAIISNLLSILKHRIAHLFLPIDLDLQGITEVLYSQKDEGKAKEYFIEAFSKKKLCQKLKEAKKIVNGDKSASEDMLKKGIKGVVGVDSIKDEEQKKSVKEILEQIESLLNNDTDINKLAEIINKDNNNGFRDLEGYLKEVKEGKKKSFNDWLCALDDCLDRFREALPERG